MKPDKPLTLVRLWLWQDNSTQKLPSAWVEWNDGTFTLPSKDPAALAMLEFGGRGGRLRLYIQGTAEGVWVIDAIETSSKRTRVECKPYLAAIRESMVSDEQLVDLWLKAERRWLESQRKTCRSEKPSHRRWIAPRTGGYRPGGDFRADANYPPPTPTTAPKGPGGVIPRSRSER